MPFAEYRDFTYTNIFPDYRFDTDKECSVYGLTISIILTTGGIPVSDSQSGEYERGAAGRDGNCTVNSVRHTKWL